MGPKRSWAISFSPSRTYHIFLLSHVKSPKLQIARELNLQCKKKAKLPSKSEIPMDPSTPAGNGGISTPNSGNTPTPTASTPSDSAAAAAADEQKQNLSQVINSIDKTLGILHQLYLTVSSFNVASQLPLLQRLYCNPNSLHNFLDS